MSIRKATFVPLLLVLALCVSSAAFALNVGDVYWLERTDNLKYKGKVTWDSKTVKNQPFGIFTFNIYDTDPNRGGEVLTTLDLACIDYKDYVADTYRATLRSGWDDLNTPGTVVDEASWMRLSNMVGNLDPFSTDANTQHAQKAGLQLSVWELMMGDSAMGPDVDWNTTGDFKATNIKPGSAIDPFPHAANYLAEAGMGDGNYLWFDGVPGVNNNEKQDLVPLSFRPPSPPEVPEVHAVALAPMGLAAFGMLRRKLNK